MLFLDMILRTPFLISFLLVQNEFFAEIQTKSEVKAFGLLFLLGTFWGGFKCYMCSKKKMNEKKTYSKFPFITQTFSGPHMNSKNKIK